MEMESLAEVKRLDRDCRAHKQQRCKLSRAGTPQLLRISGCSSQQVGAYMGGGVPNAVPTSRVPSLGVRPSISVAL